MPEAQEQLRVLVYINGSLLVSFLVIGAKILTTLMTIQKFVNRIEFKTDLMWADYQERTKVKYGRRHDDQVENND